ncbi:MAG: hypothetical protein HZC28_05660 [Spirochaetes bacterium]|nr:hypothetical protein [Spirochaetota bacterium]
MKNIIAAFVSAAVVLVVAGCIQFNRNNPLDPGATGVSNTVTNVIIFEDHFNRPDTNNLGNNWTGGTSMFPIFSNTLRSWSTASMEYTITHAIPSGKHKYMRFKFQSTMGPSGNGLTIKLGSSADDGLLAIKFNNMNQVMTGSGTNPANLVSGFSYFMSQWYGFELKDIDISAGTASLLIDGIAKGAVTFTAGAAFEKVSITANHTGDYLIDDIEVHTVGP